MLNVTELLAALSVTARVVPKKSSMPILGYIKLIPSATPGRVSITGSDLETYVHTDVAGEIAAPICLPCHRLVSILKTAPKGSTFTLDGGSLTLSNGGRYTLPTLPADEYPDVYNATPLDATFTIAADTLRAAVSVIEHAMADRDVQYYLNGLCFQGDAAGELDLVTTDGHRLAQEHVLLGNSTGEAWERILPRDAVAPLLAALKADKGAAVTVNVRSDCLVFIMPSVTLRCKIINSKYPDWRRIVPASASAHAIVNREGLIVACKAMAPHAGKYKACRFSLNGTVSLTCEDPEGNESQQTIAGEYTGAPMTIGFRLTYIMDAAASLTGDNIDIRLTDKNSCCRIDSAHGARVIMSMRL